MTPRDRPYIWITWIAPLLAGDESCKWKTWFRAHFENYPRAPRGDMSEWNRQHTVLLDRLQAEYQMGGFKVTREDQNGFKLEGESATVSGKIDLIAWKPEKIVTIDGKTGKAKDSNTIQVKLYQYLLPMARKLLGAKEAYGHVAYKDHKQDIRIEPAQITTNFKQNVVDLIKLIGADEEPPRVPSYRECKFCDLIECPDRVTEDPKATKTSLF